MTRESLLCQGWLSKVRSSILERDADGLMEVLGSMMRGQIVMPAELITDGND